MSASSRYRSAAEGSAAGSSVRIASLMRSSAYRPATRRDRRLRQVRVLPPRGCRLPAHGDRFAYAGRRPDRPAWNVTSALATPKPAIKLDESIGPRSGPLSALSIRDPKARSHARPTTLDKRTTPRPGRASSRLPVRRAAIAPPTTMAERPGFSAKRFSPTNTKTCSPAQTTPAMIQSAAPSRRPCVFTLSREPARPAENRSASIGAPIPTRNSAGQGGDELGPVRPARDQLRRIRAVEVAEGEAGCHRVAPHPVFAAG